MLKMTNKKAIIFDMFGTLVEAVSPEQEIIKLFNLPQEKHDGLQRIVCGVNFYKDCEGDLERYYELVLQKLGLEKNLDNFTKLKRIYSEVILINRQNISIQLEFCRFTYFLFIQINIPTSFRREKIKFILFYLY